jgi:uncharacterized protein YjiS (DUF1127 family)
LEHKKEVAMLSHLKSRFARWRAYRDTVRELTALDRSILADIGFEPQTPAAIRSCARQAVRDAARL